MLRTLNLIQTIPKSINEMEMPTSHKCITHVSKEKTSVVPKVQALVKMPLQYIQLTLTYLWYIYLLLVHIFNVFKVQIKIQLLSKYGISGEFLCLNCKFF